MEKIQSTGVVGPLSDEKLFSLCKMFGARALEARRKFLGLLPEVNKRELAEKIVGRSWLARRGFYSIFEFAKKLAGVSEEQVRNVLNLNRQFEEKPVLLNLLINGEVSVNKLIRVASIATPENQEVLAEKVKLLPNRALEVLVRDVKHCQESADTSVRPETKCNLPNGFQETIFTPSRLHVQLELRGAKQPGLEQSGDPFGPHLSNISRDFNLMRLLAENVKAELADLAQKGIDINKIITDALRMRTEKIVEEKEKISQAIGAPVPSRYISIKTRRILSEEFGAKCSINGCYRKSQIIHHTQRFSLSRNHDPRFLAPLCKEHHAIAHVADVKFWECRPG